MAEKKINVLGEAGDASLSPEDEHKIEVKVDRLLSLDDEKSSPELLEHQTVTPLEPTAAEETAEPAHEELTEPAGAPPVDKKLVKKITITDASEEPAAPEAMTEPAVEVASESMEPTEPEIEPEAEAAAESVIAQESAQAAEPIYRHKTKQADQATEPVEPVEPLEPEAPATEPSETEDQELETPASATEQLADNGKRYRPPDGPMPFKRAEQSAEAAQGPEAAAAANLSAEELEDAAIAAAFAPKTQPAGKPASWKTKNKNRRQTKVLAGVALIVVIGLAAAVLAVPSLRHRLTGTTKPKTASQTATPKSTATTPATTSNTTTTPLPDVFLAKSDAIYNLYKIDQSGQNKQQLLAGSGYETSPTTQLVANSTTTVAALVSLRDNTKDTAGYPLQTLTLVDVTTGTATKVTQAQRLQLLGWYGSRLVYVASKTGSTAATDPNSYQLMAYDTASKQSQVLDHAAHFNAVLAVHDQLYYATDGSAAGLYQIKPDGTGKQTVLNKLVTNLYRSGYNSLALATAGGWYNLDVTTSDAKPVSTVNAYTAGNKLYIDSPDQRNSLHLETQKGSTSLLLYNLATKKDTVLSTQAGLAYPLHWLSNSTAVYRIDTDTLTADYTVNVTNGSSAKLVDTSSFLGLEP